ncbi:Sym1 protein [Globisporangium polare]
MRSFRVFYDECLRKQPLLTKCVTSGILFGVGDRLAQHLEGRSAAAIEAQQLEKEQPVDKFVDYEKERQDEKEAAMQSAKRTARMMLWGGLGFAPIAHTWYNFIEKLAPGSTAMAVAKKIAMDQVFFAPSISTTFYTVTQSLEGKSLHDALQVAKEKVPPTLRVNYMVWPLVHLFTFNFVPLQYRILYINFVSIGWSTFLSQMTNAKTTTAGVAPLLEAEVTLLQSSTLQAQSMLEESD